jgi:predicted nucleic acid-binding protein
VTAYYFDTSALVKRYVLETGTSWVLSLVDPVSAHDLYMVQLTGPELIAALFRRVRTGSLSLADARRVASNFRADWQNQYLLVEIRAGIVERAMALAETHGLRGYDSVHLAAALEVEIARRAQQLPSLVFVSADNDQLIVASTEGLQVENPNSYP